MLVAVFELYVLENQVQFNISIFLSVLQRWIFPPLISQMGCIAGRVATENRRDASLPDGLAINTASATGRSLAFRLYQSHKRTQAAGKRELEGWR